MLTVLNNGMTLGIVHYIKKKSSIGTDASSLNGQKVRTMNETDNRYT